VIPPFRSLVVSLVLPFVGGLAAASTASAAEPTPGYHPWAPTAGQVRTIDMSARHRSSSQSATRPPPSDWVVAGGVALPAAVVAGEALVDPDVMYAIEDWPGNEYPRKHTLFLNFNGAPMRVGSDNSAENTSILAREGDFPAYTGGEQNSLSIVQAVENDVAPYGIRVASLERPPKIRPYTMEMIGGSWHDVNIDSAAGGVAPGADCGALGQRHVVYTFAAGSTPVGLVANTASQEAGHAWGLDHTFNCNSVMSYCGQGEKSFSSTCDALCEAGCQGANTAGCRLAHEQFCGAGTDQQNEDATLSWLFGGNEPDVEPPTATIVSPVDQAALEDLADINLAAEIGDNYGGYGWAWRITHDDEVIFDEVDYERTIDDEYRPALRLTNLETGVWRFTITVQDQYDNVTTDTVVITVGDAELPPATTTAGEDGTAGDSETATGGLPADDTGTDPPPEDCACRGGTAPQATPWLMFLLLPAFARRPRRKTR
jgi:hypothetical protein